MTLLKNWIPNNIRPKLRAEEDRLFVLHPAEVGLPEDTGKVCISDRSVLAVREVVRLRNTRMADLPALGRDASTRRAVKHVEMTGVADGAIEFDEGTRVDAGYYVLLGGESSIWKGPVPHPDKKASVVMTAWDDSGSLVGMVPALSSTD